MGNQKSEFQERFNNNYGFIQAYDDPIYGLVKIYRKKFQNYHYVMVIERRLEQFNNQTFMTDCIRSQKKHSYSLQKHRIQVNTTPKLFFNERNGANQQYDSVKLQRLKRTLQLIKRFQDDLMTPLFSYQILNGNKFNCSEPVIQLYIEYQNHRLYQYLQVLRSKQFHLKLGEIIYILRCVCSAIIMLQKMEIDVSYKQINIRNILSSNQGQIKFNPIEILTRREQQEEMLQNIVNLKFQSQTNQNIQGKKIIVNRTNKSSRTGGEKRLNEKESTSSNAKQKDPLFSSNESFFASMPKLMSHKEILRKILLELSAYLTPSKNSLNKDLQWINLAINKGHSLMEISNKLQRYERTCLDGLLVYRIYDHKEEQNHNQSTMSNNNNNNQLEGSTIKNLQSLTNENKKVKKQQYQYAGKNDLIHVDSQTINYSGTKSSQFQDKNTHTAVYSLRNENALQNGHNIRSQKQINKNTIIRQNSAYFPYNNSILQNNYYAQPVLINSNSNRPLTFNNSQNLLNGDYSYQSTGKIHLNTKSEY